MKQRSSELYSVVKGNDQDGYVVLLHGFLASAKYWRSVQNDLAKTYKTITFDLLGFGKSPKPRGDYTYEDHIDAIVASIKSQGIEQPFTLVGHSMGALLALRLAKEYPQMVNSVKLFNPPLFLDREQARANLSATGKVYRFILYSPWRRWFWRAIKLFPVFYVPAGYKRRGHVGVMRHAYYARERSLENIIEKQAAFEDLLKVQLPVDLVVSRYDRYAYQENLQKYTLPDNVNLIFKESDHHYPIREPKEAIKIIKS